MIRRWKLTILLVAALTVVALVRFTDHHGLLYRATDHTGKTDPHATHRGARPGAGDAPDDGGPPGQPSATPRTRPEDAFADRFFTPTKLRRGQRPPQFVVVSFDGAGSHEKWNFWRDVAKRAGMRFTGFLSGVYLLDEAHADTYQAPGHQAGASDVGFADDGPWITTLVNDLNDAWQRGYEIGTHYNGHFCDGAAHPVGTWSTAEWNSELDQFFRFYRDYRKLNDLPDAPRLKVPATSVRGGRTPCLEGDPKALFPALSAHGMDYDSSGDTNGIQWPTKGMSGIWRFPMAWVPMAGTERGVISMDYNFYYMQHQAENVADEETAAGDSQQVLQTYRQMFDAVYHGNRAPLVLGNHFNDWNHDAYTNALADFVKETCGKPEVKCVPYRDVIRWMEAQDPSTLSRLQRLPAVDTVG